MIAKVPEFGSTGAAFFFGEQANTVEKLPGDITTASKITSKSYTIEMWILPVPYFVTSGTQEHYLFTQYTGGRSRMIFETHGTTAFDTKLRLGVNAAGESMTFLSSTSALQMGRWTHVAATQDESTGKWSLYINGQLDAEMEAPGIVVPENTYNQIGGYSGNISSRFAGAITEVRTWSVARSEEELQELMHTRLTGTEENLNGYWPLDGGECDGTLTNVARPDEVKGTAAVYWLEFGPNLFETEKKSHGTVLMIL